jgi:hypothetical protein
MAKSKNREHSEKSSEPLFMSKSKFFVRACLGFVLAPTATVPLIILVAWIETGRLQAGPLAAFQLAAFAYAATFFFLLILGLPLGYFMVRFWRTSLFDFCALGAVSGPFLILLFVAIFGRTDGIGAIDVPKAIPFLLLTALLGSAESSLFWLIARPDKLQQIRTKSTTANILKNSADFKGK